MNVNFLPEKKVKFKEERSLQKRLVVLSVSVFVLILLLSVFSGLYQGIQESQLSDTQSQKVKIVAELEAESSKVAALMRIHHKVEGIKYILSSQFDYSKNFDDFFSLLPQGVNPKSVSIDSAGVLKAELTASNSAALSGLVHVLKDSPKNYKEIRLGAISFNGKDPFTLSVNLKVPATQNEK